MHQRIFSGAELDVALHMLRVQQWYLACESWIRGLQIQQASVCRPETGTETSISRDRTFLAHLFRHKNMAVHVAKRVIPRFVTSNPSPASVNWTRRVNRDG